MARMDSSPVGALACGSCAGRLLQGRKGSTAPVPAPAPATPRRKPSRKPEAAMRTASPMPPRPLRLASQNGTGQRQAEKPGGAEGNQPRPCDDDTGKVIDLPAPEIRPGRAHKSDEEQRPLQDGCHGSAAQRAGVVEHILDTLVQGGHDHIAEQSVEARQQQRAPAPRR